MRKRLGIVMAVVPFVGLFFFGALLIGWVETFLVFCGYALLMLWVFAAVYLMGDK